MIKHKHTQQEKKSFDFLLKGIFFDSDIKREKCIRGKKMLQLSFCISQKGAIAMLNKGGGCASACGNAHRLSDSGSVRRETEGERGQREHR